MTQPAFLTAVTDVSSADVLIVESADLDRSVVVLRQTTSGVLFAFTEVMLDSGDGVALRDHAEIINSGPVGAFQFVLPADEELWARGPSSSTVHVLVTKVGGDN